MNNKKISWIILHTREYFTYTDWLFRLIIYRHWLDSSLTKLHRMNRTFRSSNDIAFYQQIQHPITLKLVQLNQIARFPGKSSPHDPTSVVAPRGKGNRRNETREDTRLAGLVSPWKGLKKARAIWWRSRRGRWAPALTSHLTPASRLFYLIRDLRMRTRRPPRHGIPCRPSKLIKGKMPRR